jgi:uncharacterized protein (DUF1684 family)
MKYSLLLALILHASVSSFSQDDLNAHREQYKKDFLTDPRSPLKEEDLKYLDFFPVLSSAAVEAEFIKTPAEQPFEMPTYSGVTRTYRKYGTAYFTWGPFNSSVVLYENMTNKSNPLYKDYLFLPFTDNTNGETTYGGGRYIDMSKADAEDGKIIIDFNRCYNPWCAYSDGFNCPIPPLDNKLPYAIEAGEKMYKGEHKKVKSEK